MLNESIAANLEHVCWWKHFYSGPGLARDDRVKSRASVIWGGDQERRGSIPPICTKTCLTLQFTSLCPLGQANDVIWVQLREECDNPGAQTCLLDSVCNPTITLHWKRKSWLSARGPCSLKKNIPILFPPSPHRMTRSSHVPVILGETKRGTNPGVWGCCSRRNMFVTTVQTTYNQAGLLRTMFCWVVSVCKQSFDICWI